jgi:hypothetical protein
MSWHDENSQWRVPVTVDNNGGAATIDVSLNIPRDFGAFWANVRSDGHDIKICDSDGHTELTWQRANWNYTTRTALLEVDNWTPSSSDATVVLYLYWGYDGTPADTSGSFTATAPKTATVLPCTPAPGMVIVDAQTTPVGSSTPAARYSFPPGADGCVVFDITRHIARQAQPHNGHAEYEEVASITVESRNDGTPYAGGNNPARTRLSQWGGRTLVYMWVEGGVNGADYVDEVSVTMNTLREFVFAAIRYANTAEEPA